MMSALVTRAIQLCEEAGAAAEQGNIDRAEVLYLESRELFLQEGGAHFVDAFQIMKRIAYMKESLGDFEGAILALENAARLLETHAGSGCSS